MFDWLGFKPGMEKFARALMDHARRHGYDQPMRFDAEGSRIVTGVNQDGVVNLANLYPGYRDAPRGEREAFLARCLAVFDTPDFPATFTEARANLLPVIRSRSYLEAARLANGTGGNGELAAMPTPPGPDCVLLIAFDRDDTLGILTAAQVRTWGVPFDDVLATALDNLRAMSAERFERRSDGVVIGAWGDAYDSSRLLLPELVQRAGIADPVAMIPTRGTLLLAPAADRGALLAMLGLAEAAHAQEGRCVSASMFDFRGGAAQVHTPDDPEVAARLAAFGQAYLSEDYAAQKRALDDLHQKDGADIFVATFMRMQDDRGGAPFSICSWTEGVDALLPKTDRVALVVMDADGVPQSSLVVEWNALHAVAGQLMAPQPDGWPLRYRVTHFPDLGRLTAVS